jgi:hypothetical protein
MATTRFCQYGHRIERGPECPHGHPVLEGGTESCLWCERNDGSHSPLCERAQAAERKIEELSGAAARERGAIGQNG